MDLKTLKVERLGPIDQAEVQFGDLTVLVGPQATGKSIFLQFLKLLLDSGPVLAALQEYGLNWDKEERKFLDIYLGEGMQWVWSKEQSQIAVNDIPIDLAQLVRRQRKPSQEKLFFIPAQRVLTLGKGWPRPFADYSPGDPFAVRDFSEKLRRLMESELGRGETIFPQKGRLKAEIRDLLNATVFSSYDLRVDKHGPQKRLVLKHGNTEDSLPFMVWSAGQREFVPLLLGLYWLLPPTKVPRRAAIKWVVIEELEMGLHPKAISAVLVLVLELLRRGYRVCLSTHSPHVLDVVWALQVFQQNHADPQKVLDLFGLQPSPAMKAMAAAVMKKVARVYYFSAENHRSIDISSLDPGADNLAEAGWGGLTDFSGHVADVVASVVNAATE